MAGSRKIPGATSMTLQGVILDIDGTLVLSNDIHAQAWVEAFAAFGYDISFDKVRPLMGMGGDHVIPLLVPDLNDEEGDGKAIADRRKALILNELGQKIVSANGSRDLVLKMQSEGLKLTIASSAKPEELEILLKAAQVDDLLHEATTSADADESKPAPGIIEAALQKSQFDPKQVVMLGDTPYDIEAAGKAGVSVIAMRCGGFSDDELAGAIAIYNDPADLLQHYDQSPLAK
jgi:phosphoglycolate phosphatase-like HAD superfamily hydrolase